MNVRNCRKCGKIFNYVVGPFICPSCREAQEAKFQEVKKYVEEHKGASIPEVAEACEVEVSEIHQWIREDRLQFAEDSPIRIACESCGTMIRSGRFCEACKNDMAHNLSSAYKKATPEAPKQQKSVRDRDKMRFL